MKKGIVDAWKNFLKLFRFLAWYVIALAAVLYFLPIVGLFLEGRYDAMSGSVKLFSIIGFFAVIALWQLVHLRSRHKDSKKLQDPSRVPDFLD